MGARKLKPKRAMLKQSKPSAGQARSMTVGEELCTARERSGVPINEAAGQLCLSVAFLRALEEDSYSKLPGPIYVRGYIRAYARLLSLSADALIEKYNEGLSDEPYISQPSTEKTVSVSRPTFRTNRARSHIVIYLLTAVVIGIILLLSLSYWSKSDRDGSPSTGLEKVSIEGADGRLIFEDFSSEGGEVSPIFQPQELELAGKNENAVATVPKDRVAASEENAFTSFIDSLFVSAEEECWVKVTDGSGGTLHAALMSPGESLSLFGLAPFKVVVGNVQGVSLNFNGEHVNLDSYQSRQSRVAVVKLGGQIRLYSDR